MALSFQDKIKPVKTSSLSFSDKVTSVSPAEESLGFAGRVKERFGEAGRDIVSGIKESAVDIQQGRGVQGVTRAALRTVGGVAEAAFAPITEAPVIKPAIGALGTAISKIPGVKSVVERFGRFAEKRPVLAKDIKNIIDITTLGGVSAIRKPVITSVGKAAGKTATILEKGLEKQTLKETLKLIEPILSTKETARALSAGRGQVSARILPRRFETVTLSSTGTQEEMARAVSGIIFRKKHPIDNIGALITESKAVGQKIRTGLKESDAIWNKNELKSRLAKVERPITVKSDTALTNQANNFNRALTKIADKANKKAEGILDVRQEFDRLVNKEFPNLYDKEMIPIRQYISNTRKTLNEFAESKLHE